MTVLPKAMATRNRFLTTAKALERALRQAESDQPATDSAPFFSRARGTSPTIFGYCLGQDTIESPLADVSIPPPDKRDYFVPQIENRRAWRNIVSA